jgi:hypothetical protein
MSLINSRKGVPGDRFLNLTHRRAVYPQWQTISLHRVFVYSIKVVAGIQRAYLTMNWHLPKHGIEYSTSLPAAEPSRSSGKHPLYTGAGCLSLG